MAEKIFCGKGKKGQYSIKLNICLDNIPAEFKTVATNGKTYLRLETSERRSPDDRGNTHFVTVDTWRPQGQRQAQAKYSESNHEYQAIGNPDDLPF